MQKPKLKADNEAKRSPCDTRQQQVGYFLSPERSFTSYIVVYKLAHTWYIEVCCIIMIKCNV